MRNNNIHSCQRFFLAGISIILLFAGNPAAGDRGSDFFNKLEGELRSDYFSCTGDTTQRPIEELVIWKRWTDSLISLPNFEKALKEYQKKTGRSPKKDGNCVVALWKRKNDSLAAIDSAIAKEKADFEAEIKAQPKLPCAIAGIPFGISRQTFLVLAGKAKFGLISYEGDVMLCQKVPVGEQFLTGQFHFDTNGKYDRYELQGPSFPVDSLYIAVWPQAEYLTSFFWNAIAAPPLRVNRINQQDIVEGKLTLSKMWSDPQWSVAIGISVQNYRYYTKAVVMNKPLNEE